MHRLLVATLFLAATACATLPEPRLAEAPAEQSHTVAEISPGHYHVMVRGATFAPRAATETLLRGRAARLCGAQQPVIHHLQVTDHPAMASGEVTCAATPEPPATATAPAAAVLPATPPAMPRYPAASLNVPSPMVDSGAGLLPRPPTPGYIPPFARVGDGAPKVAARTPVGDGWMPATGEAPEAGAVTAVEEGEITSPPFWPQVKETYRAVYAGSEE